MVKKTLQEIERELETISEKMIQESFERNGPAYYELLEDRVKLRQLLKGSRVKPPDAAE
jgi:hypothetical protein